MARQRYLSVVLWKLRGLSSSSRLIKVDVFSLQGQSQGKNVVLWNNDEERDG
jgi:hypothetical protein